MSGPSFVPPPPGPPVLQPPSFAGYAGTPGQLEGVGFWPRAGARLIDLVFHFFVSIAAGLVMGIGLAIYASVSGQSIQPWLVKIGHNGWLAYVFAALGSVASNTICESLHGSTLGKLLLSMVVVKEDGSPCTLDSAVIRNLAYFLDAFFFGMVGYMAMQKSPQQQRYGDQWAHTIVCKRALVSPQNLRSGGRFAVALLFGAFMDAVFLGIGWLTNLA
ncbi:MAG TPA: RDD family protein [Verrucomicrobiae bacterium]|jgi:uncharacterized RDD family membrane protein YckC|nr:RDD family protein [Verrucomicrobiae bacterium]